MINEYICEKCGRKIEIPKTVTQYSKKCPICGNFIVLGNNFDI